VKAFLDTSVLIPVFQSYHIHHKASMEIFRKFPQREACCAAHSLAEVYSTLTRMPPPYRFRSEQAMLFLSDIESRLNLIALDANEYFQAIGDLAAMGVAGGAIYDGLLARCALKAKAQSIYTWNVRHFRQFGPDIEKKLRTP
jgi:predicted nucleic acid-binding protein